jgi:anti-anti-sigma factor
MMKDEQATDMQFSFDPRGPTIGVVFLSGRLDLLVAHSMKAELQRLVGEGWNRLVVDLSAVPFVDSSGLGALIGALKAARLAGGDCRIARPNDQVRYILQVSTLDRVLTPYTSVEDALVGYR